MSHLNWNVQNAAVEALEHYVPAYLLSMESKGVNDITSRYLEQLTDPNVASRRGSALGLGVLPFQLLARDWKPVLSKLCSSCAVEVYFSCLLYRGKSVKLFTNLQYVPPFCYSD